ncbi:MAG TPA: hypothetical protein VEV85_25210 [Bryobacteraceae bacterium]|nr:hypothetical protein [Bryobacteraceae bacterium]
MSPQAAPSLLPSAAGVSPPVSKRNRSAQPWGKWLIFATSLFLVTWLLALALAAYSSNPAHIFKLMRIGAPLLDPVVKDRAEWIAVGLSIVIGVTLAKYRPKAPQRLEGKIGRFALNRRQSILLCGLVPAIVRLALLPVFRVPQPLIADEFGYLLIADTFASGRLTNPPHPLWKFFEAIYVLHHPTYTSIYPVAPAVLLAIPQAFGASPWLGVWFGASLMCALICWMLQGWMPPKWALLGGLIAALRFSIAGPWMNNFWGGSTAAIGGALMLGALPRIMKGRRARDSALFGLGLMILAQSRPYECLLFSVPLLTWLGVWLLRERGFGWNANLRRVALPLGAAFLLLVAGSAYYNLRVTGHPFLMPYSLHQKVYGTPPGFYWQHPVMDAPAADWPKDVADVFRWQMDAHRERSWRILRERLLSFWRFYFQPLLTVPLFFLAFLWRDRRLLLLTLTALLVLAGNCLYPFYFPHYTAPMCGLLVLLIVEGMRRLRAVKLGAAPLGIWIVRSCIPITVLSGLATIAGGLMEPWFVTAADTPRSAVYKQLDTGKHVVFVRYGPRHSFHDGVVFNDADIDKSRIVWARDLGPENDGELMQYYRDREFWIYDPDVSRDALAPMGGTPYISAVTGATGRRDDIREGISPGALVVLFGGNFARQLRGATASPIWGAVAVRLEGVSAEYGDEFAPGAGVAAGSPDQKALSAFNNISVRFGGQPARILSISNLDGQESITLQAPFRMPLGQVPVELRVGAQVSVKKVAVLPATPGIFQMRMSDSNLRGLVLHADGTLVDLENPAHRGEVLRMFATGLGPLAWRASGPGGPPAFFGPAQPLIVGVADHGASLVSAKYSVVMPGVTEIDFAIPSDTPPGPDVHLLLAVVVDGEPVYSNKSFLPVE